MHLLNIHTLKDFYMDNVFHQAMKANEDFEKVLPLFLLLTSEIMRWFLLNGRNLFVEMGLPSTLRLWAELFFFFSHFLEVI